MSAPAQGETNPPAKRNRPYLGVLFACCHVYTRILPQPRRHGVHRFLSQVRRETHHPRPERR